LYFNFLTRIRDFIVDSTSIRAFGPTQAPVHWVPVAVFPGIKRSGSQAEHLRVSSDEVKNGAVPLFPTHAFMAWIRTALPLLLYKKQSLSGAQQGSGGCETDIDVSLC